MLFGGFSSTRVTKFNVVSTNPYFEKLADLWQIWPYSRYRGIGGVDGRSAVAEPAAADHAWPWRSRAEHALLM